MARAATFDPPQRLLPTPVATGTVAGVMTQPPVTSDLVADAGACLYDLDYLTQVISHLPSS